MGYAEIWLSLGAAFRTYGSISYLMEDLSVTVWICLLLFRFQDVRTGSEFHPHDITDMAWGIATAGRRWVPEEGKG